MTRKRQVGFSLLETLVALAVLLVVGGIVMTGMVQLMKTQSTIANRTEKHTSVRSATELLQQEIGQAGQACPRGPPTHTSGWPAQRRIADPPTSVPHTTPKARIP